MKQDSVQEFQVEEFFNFLDDDTIAINTIGKTRRHNKSISLFFSFTVCVSLFFAFELWKVKKEGYTATDNSEEAITRFFYTCGSFITVTVFGLILLTCRIRHLLLAISYMFLVVCVINLGVLSLSRAAWSLVRDDFQQSITLLETGIANKYDLTRKEDFYNKVQQAHYCCGWGPDVLEAWPFIFETADLPSSCCITMKNGCGKNATYTKVSMGGHTIIIAASKLSVPRNVRLHGNIYEWDRYHWINESLRALRRTKLEPTKEIKTTEIAMKGNKNGGTSTRSDNILSTKLALRLLQGQFRKIDYAQTEIGVHVGLTHFWDVTNAEVTNMFENRRHVLYLSKGLIEGIIFQDYIFHKRCEKIGKKSPNYEVPRLKDAYPQYDFIMGLTRRRMGFIIGMTSITIIMIIILSIFFWSTYSKMKAEELTNLAPPGDFDLLDLQLPPFGNLNELQRKRRRKAARKKAETSRQKEMAHIAVAPKLAQAFDQAGIIPEDGTAVNPNLLYKEKTLPKKARNQRKRGHRRRELSSIKKIISDFGIAEAKTS